ncbi:MAG: DegT/DnrJ/EryC1/StrS family aminotransferase [Solirubrobacteraceae bacterium]
MTESAAPSRTGASRKRALDDLALLGGDRAFHPPVSTSNLTRPDPERLLGYARRVHDARRLTGDGPLGAELEARLRTFHECEHVVTFSCGFWALALAVRCLALPGRTEVLMPSLTYRRMADAVAWTGLIPRFCEIDPVTLAMTRATAAAAVTDETALILGAQPIVNCCDMSGLEALAADTGLPLLIDSVESTYESHEGRRIGNFGRAELFSMHASKLVNGMEGGYVTTNEGELAQRLRRLRSHGADADGEISELGLNARLSEVHAAFALANLDGLEACVAHNEAIYRAYRRALGDLPGLRLLAFDESERCSFKNIVVELRDSWPLSRELTIAHLNGEGVLARAYYHPPLHARPTSYETRGRELPVSDALGERFLLLPCGANTGPGDVADVVELLRFLSDNGATLADGAGR